MGGSLLLSLILACGPTEDPSAVTEPSATSTESPTSDPSDPTEPVLTDEALVRDLADGLRSPGEVLPAVAWSGGLPVETEAGTWLFVHESEGDGADLAGDFNEWTPTPMTAGAGFFWAEVEIPEPEGARYKFVDDGATWRADPWARSYTYDAFGEISFVAPPPDAARFDRWPGLAAEGLLPRDLRVHVPPGEGPWPALYAQDGQNLFDPAAPHGGWSLDAAVAEVGAILVVGIDPSAERLAEYAHVDDAPSGEPVEARGEAYARLVQDHVRPHVEAHYPTRGHDGLLGSSMGGLAALYIAHQAPEDWDFVASLSGTLGWGRLTAAGPLMIELYEEAGPRSFAIYVDSGGGDGGDGCNDHSGDGFPVDDPNQADNYCANRHFADTLAEVGYTWDADLFHWHEPGAAHDEAAWGARVWRPLQLFLDLEE